MQFAHFTWHTTWPKKLAIVLIPSGLIVGGIVAGGGLIAVNVVIACVAWILMVLAYHSKRQRAFNNIANYPTLDPGFRADPAFRLAWDAWARRHHVVGVPVRVDRPLIDPGVDRRLEEVEEALVLELPTGGGYGSDQPIYLGVDRRSDEEDEEAEETLGFEPSNRGDGSEPPIELGVDRRSDEEDEEAEETLGFGDPSRGYGSGQSVRPPS
ncbi:MAG: hypothetical protein KGR16_06315 [Verrucomicrobia bacterium]|nr:hypothetical protein [Verrucomicrobiota bacterium]